MMKISILEIKKKRTFFDWKLKIYIYYVAFDKPYGFYYIYKINSIVKWVFLCEKEQESN